MSCQSEVTVLGVKGCSNLIMNTTDNYNTSTATHIPCMGGRVAKVRKETLNLSFWATDEMIQEMAAWFASVLDYGRKPFAVYTKHLGRIRWWVLKFNTNSLKFNEKGITTNEMSVIGYAADDSVTLGDGDHHYWVDANGNKVVDEFGNTFGDVTPNIGKATKIKCI